MVHTLREEFQGGNSGEMSLKNLCVISRIVCPWKWFFLKLCTAYISGQQMPIHSKFSMPRDFHFVAEIVLYTPKYKLFLETTLVCSLLYPKLALIKIISDVLYVGNGYTPQILYNLFLIKHGSSLLKEPLEDYFWWDNDL